MTAFWIIFMLAVGACVGSFLNVVVYRMPRGESIVFPPSHCPACGRAIRWYDNVPLVSWWALGGKCRFCKTSISPRYLVVEAATALMVAGLWAAYYVFHFRQGAGPFAESWPMFAAHAALLCGLLACSLVDVEHWIIPLEVCWVVSLIGAVSAAASPHPWLPRVAPAVGAMAIPALAGLVVSLLLVRWGLLQRSFIDAEDMPLPAGVKKNAPPTVAASKASGVDPRREVVRELLFLAPAAVLAVTAWLLVTRVPAVGELWGRLSGQGRFAWHFNALLASLMGYLIGGLWIWGIRIFGTLLFGKEAMGLGDAHLMATVGAVCGWVVPSVAFFVAPFFGLLWALYLWLGRNQRELPYGPWLAVASVAVMLSADTFDSLAKAYTNLFASFY